MEADGEFVARRRGMPSPSGGSEAVLAVERARRRRRASACARWMMPKSPRIAVMRGAQHDAPSALSSRVDAHVVRAADDRRCRTAARANAPDSRKRHDDVSLNVTVECAAVARATCRQVSRFIAGRPQLTTSRCCFHDSSNDRQPACASWLTAIGGGRPVSISSTVLAGVDALIAGMRRVRHRRAARVVIGEHGGEQVDLGRAHAVELREIAVAVAEEAQHRHHAVDGVVERRRRLRRCARENNCRSGSRSSSSSISAPGLRLMWPPSGRIWRCSSSISLRAFGAQVPRLALHAQRREGERDQRLQPRQAVARIRSARGADSAPAATGCG